MKRFVLTDLYFGKRITWPTSNATFAFQEGYKGNWREGIRIKEGKYKDQKVRREIRTLEAKEKEKGLN